MPAFARSARAFTVTVADSAIILTQSNIEGEDAMVFISPDQVPLLCQWLQEAGRAVVTPATPA